MRSIIDNPDNSKAISENLLHEYDCLWSYYNKLLEERHIIFNNFLMVIGVPLTAVGFIIGIIGGQNVEDYTRLLSVYRPILRFILYVLCIIGFLFYLQYVFESVNATNYYRRIVKIKTLIAQLTSKLYCEDKFSDKIFEAYGIVSADKRSSVFDMTRVVKVMILPTINSAIFIGALLLSNFLSWSANLIGAAFFIAQIAIFIIYGKIKK